MNYYTHITGAILFYLAYAYLTGLNNPLLGVIFAAGISLFPDLVEKVSKKHRVLGHSIIWLVPLSLFALSSVPLAVALIIGFLTHLLLDFFTVRGCPFLYPYKEKSFACLHPKRRITSGSNEDKVLFILIVMLMIPLVIVTFNLLAPIENSMGFAYANGGGQNTTETMSGDVNVNLNLNNASNKNVTVQKTGNTTNILIMDIQAQNETG